MLERAGLDGLVVDQIHQGVSAVAMATGVPFVHVACTPLIDVTGVTPLWLFPWPHEDSEAARQRNRMGVDGFLKMANGLAALIVDTWTATASRWTGAIFIGGRRSWRT